jgi:5-methylcytosine-specific restriction enzyme subunit McrC
MMQGPTKEGDHASVRLGINEWSSATPATCPELRGLSFQEHPGAGQIAAQLNDSHILHARETLHGLEFEATSWVGSLTLGPVTVTVQPKIEFRSLEVLIRYAYGLSDFRILSSDTVHELFEQSLQDLLVSQFEREASHLVYRGLFRHYVPMDAKLASPRGRIDFAAIAREGGVRQAALPCKYYPRTENWVLNRLLRAGLRMAATLTSDIPLSRRIHRLDTLIPEDVTEIRLNLSSLRDSERHITRLTEHYRPAVRITELLLQGQGVTLDNAQDEVRLPGFLFDMNVFWQRLLEQFLSENIHDATIRSQASLTDALRYQPDANPLRRKNPPLRPDFVVIQKNRVVAVLDAKYKDLWAKAPDASWLYQMAVYGSVFKEKAEAIMLYPSMREGSKDQRLEIRNPSTRTIFGNVVMRPVSVPLLVSIILANDKRMGQKLVNELVFGASIEKARAAQATA